MPQVTGAVTWETNVAKRQTSQKKPVVVDNSLTRIENHHMEARMRIRVGRLEEEKQRNATDRNIEIRNIERDLVDFARLKNVLKENRVDPVMEKWRRQRLARAASAAPRVVITRPDHGSEKLHPDRNFSKAFINDDDDVNYLQSVRTRRSRSRSAAPTHKRRKSPSPSRATPLIRAPSADSSPEKKHRPKTTAGRSSDHLAVTTTARTRPSSSVHLSQATRSFQVLRDLTKLEHLKKGQMLAAAEWQHRTDELQSDEAGLQLRMSRFFRDIDDFKKRDTKEYQALLSLAKYK
ncbi:hypothetical protein NP493_39g04030 [Ridgeia piscesae]|uniref:Uncharacterized protein n=1 Tax=Ridgeia piscesae TaxID=27915 RepID=A0AAD9PC43_RIDPI|nr:hypothetical protein NP493_39g04030 [Ridgeia piscesae]